MTRKRKHQTGSDLIVELFNITGLSSAPGATESDEIRQSRNVLLALLKGTCEPGYTKYCEENPDANEEQKASERQRLAGKLAENQATPTFPPEKMDDFIANVGGLLVKASAGKAKKAKTARTAPSMRPGASDVPIRESKRQLDRWEVTGKGVKDTDMIDAGEPRHNSTPDLALQNTRLRVMTVQLRRERQLRDQRVTASICLGFLAPDSTGDKLTIEDVNLGCLTKNATDRMAFDQHREVLVYFVDSGEGKPIEDGGDLRAALRVALSANMNILPICIRERRDSSSVAAPVLPDKAQVYPPEYGIDTANPTSKKIITVSEYQTWRVYKKGVK